VIARAVPAQKLRLVQALQADGQIVAVTGDGVNDVPALQAADIGIAMGERGTRSAREVGAIVLLDDNFRTIVTAIREGQQLFRNLRSSFAYLLMIHIPLVATATLIPLAGYPLLYLPIHIVWLELIIHPTALLAFQELNTNARLNSVRERERAGQFFNTQQWIVVVAVGAALTLVVLFGYERSVGVEPNVEHARAMALVTLVIASASLTATLSRLRTLAARTIAAASLASAVIVVQAPLLADLLHVEPLHLDDWAVAAAGGLVPSIIAGLFHGQRWNFARTRKA
jgi:Ca2+-transporting ATPase